MHARGADVATVCLGRLDACSHGGQTKAEGAGFHPLGEIVQNTVDLVIIASVFVGPQALALAQRLVFKLPIRGLAGVILIRQYPAGDLDTDIVVIGAIVRQRRRRLEDRGGEILRHCLVEHAVRRHKQGLVVAKQLI